MDPIFLSNKLPIDDLGLAASSDGDEWELSYLREHFDILLNELGTALNDVLETTQTIRFWRVLIGPWLNNFIPFVLAQLQEQIASNYTRPTRHVPTNFDDFSASTYLIDYAQLIGIDAAGLSSEVPLSETNHPLASTNPVGRRRQVIRWLKRMHWIFQGVLCRKATIIVRDGYFSRKSEIRIWLRSCGQVRFDRRDYNFLSDNLTVDYSKRDKLTIRLGQSSDELGALLRRLIPLHLPRCYLEGFDELTKTANQYFSTPAKIYFSCNANWHDEVFKYTIARDQNEGSKILIGQHGGNYGVVKNLLVEDFERSIASKYCTWGWREDDSTVPLPSPKLMNISTKITQCTSTELLFASTTTIANSSKIDPFSKNSFENYLNWQLEFIKSLPPSMRSLLRFRTLRDWGRNFWLPLKNSFPEITFENAYQTNKSFYERLMSCRLFICDHLSTTYLEALAVNKPTILFWDPKIYQFRDSAKPIFDQLHDSGILHYNPERAAVEVSRAYIDIEAWWNDERRRDAVLKFRSHFLITSNDPERKWIDFFISEAKSK